MDHRRTIYSSKAEKYAQYRWDYAAAAVEAIFSQASLGSESVVADIGAGTGILIRRFVERVGQVYAIEPNREMLQEARKRLSGFSTCTLLETSAEATGLPDQSVDLICAAQAIHWFSPDPTQREFQRIIKPGGWLAIMWNTSSTSPVTAALQAISTPEYGVQPVHAAPAVNMPPEAYFRGAPFKRMAWPFVTEQDWDSFLGALYSASYMPDESHALFPRFEQAVRAIFDQHNQNGRISGRGETHLLIGKITGENQ
jgi:SAM-dependent methyltransferase